MKKKFREAFKKHWLLMRFAPLFIFLIILFFLLIGHRFFSDIVPIERYFTVAVTHVSGTVLNIIGMENRVEGTKICTDDPEASNPNYSVDLKTGCNGLVATLIFIAAILSFPSPWKLRLYGILLGILAIQGFNIIRIGILYYLGLNHKDLFQTVHVYVAQSILIAFAAALWLFWSAWTGKKPEMESS